MRAFEVCGPESEVCGKQRLKFARKAHDQAPDGPAGRIRVVRGDLHTLALAFTTHTKKETPLEEQPPRGRAKGEKEKPPTRNRREGEGERESESERERERERAGGREKAKSQGVPGRPSITPVNTRAEATTMPHLMAAPPPPPTKTVERFVKERRSGVP